MILHYLAWVYLKNFSNYLEGYEKALFIGYIKSAFYSSINDRIKIYSSV